jgi:hypothetical protein
MRKASLAEWAAWADRVREAYRIKAEFDDRVSAGSVLAADEQGRYNAAASIVERYSEDGRYKPQLPPQTAR